MEMDSRKEKILQAVVLDYIETAEPVGSRTISKKYNLGVSSATIRNEMADLEEMGLIIQPHTSAGRIPSDKGYRYYVDYLMHKDAIAQEAGQYIHEAVKKKTGQVEDILQTLSNNTSYMSLMLLPQDKAQARLQLLQLLPVAPGRALMVIVTDGDKVENCFIDVPEDMTKEDMDLVSRMLSGNLRGLSTDDWKMGIMENIFQELAHQKQVVDSALEMLSDILNKNNNNKVYLKGGLNMLGQPDFKDVDKVKNILATLEDSEVVNKILDSGDNEISIKIGTENDIPEMEDCSVVIATVRSKGETVGKVGVLGPKRMDYSKALTALQNVLADLAEEE